MTKTYRPGVYSQYDIISQRRTLQDRYAFYCGAAKVREGKSIPAGGVVQIHSRQELEEYFDAQGGTLFCAVCGILLDSGVSGVYAVPLTIDGNIITGEALGAAIPFALALARTLAGADAANKVKTAIVYQ